MLNDEVTRKRELILLGDAPVRTDHYRNNIYTTYLIKPKPQVFRTAQYGCNCRGMGGNGGCGEFDILEALIGNEYSDMLFTQVYDFKGAASPGTNKYFERPVTVSYGANSRTILHEAIVLSDFSGLSFPES